MRVYATPDDVHEFETGEKPEQPISNPAMVAELRRASTRIDSYTRTSVYQVDAEGYPSDAKVREAFKWATCAQHAWFKVTEDLTGAESQEGMTKIGSVQLGGMSSNSGNASATAEDARSAPEAIEILMNAGLLSSRVGHN